MSVDARQALIEATCDAYRGAGQFASHYTRAKLEHDPVYLLLLREGAITDRARLLDLGCGQGILLALLAAAEKQDSHWPQGWAAAPTGLILHGIDIHPRAVRRARAALGSRAVIVQADVCAAEFPESDVVILLDVLHYLDAAKQQAILLKASRALASSGRLIVRVADSEKRESAFITQLTDRFGALLRGELWGRYHLRPLTKWLSVLEKLDFAVRSVPLSERAAGANTLLIAQKN